MLAGLLLLLTLRLKRGGLALIIGVILFFAGLIFSGEVTYIAYATDSDVLLKIWAVINPNTALQAYYYHMGAAGLASETWVPSFSDALPGIVHAELIVAALFVVGYIYFDRRLEI